MTSYFYVSMVVHLGSNDHFKIRNLIHRNILSSSLKKQWKGEVSLKNGILRVDYKTSIYMLIKKKCIAVQYFYIMNRLFSGDISIVIYKPTKKLKSNYFTQAIKGKLININHLKFTKVNVIKSIKPKWV